MGHPPLHPTPTDGEMAILRVLWSRGAPMTVREIHDVLQRTKDTAYTTVLKMLTIMFDKRLVLRDESERSHRFVPSFAEPVVESSLVDAPRYVDRPVVILIGDTTASGCEAFAYAMQSQRRATLIGGPTAGAAYFGSPRRITDHFMAFVPVGRPIDPITHGDWEGGGVTPAVAAPPDRALDAGELSLLRALAPREPSPRRQAAMQKRIAELAPH